MSLEVVRFDKLIFQCVQFCVCDSISFVSIHFVVSLIVTTQGCPKQPDDIRPSHPAVFFLARWTSGRTEKRTLRYIGLARDGVI